MDRTMGHNPAPRGVVGIAESDQPQRPAIWRNKVGKRHAWTLVGVLLALVVAAVAVKQATSRTGLDFEARPVALDTPAPTSLALSESRKAYEQLELRRAVADTSSNLESTTAQDAGTPEAKTVTSPMIAQSASLTIVPANYDRAAGSIDALVAAHGGYEQKLDSESRPDASRQISLTLRVPVKQMGAFLADLRQLGTVEMESRENEEVTDQYVDLDARLQSSRASEQRLIQLLGTRTGKLEDVLDAERELTRVRGEIEGMSGERNLLLHRVEYATVELQLQEQYRAQISSGTPTGSLRNALVEGLRNLESGVITAVAFVLAYGPSVVFWLAIFGIPAWLAWRGARRRFATPQ